MRYCTLHNAKRICFTSFNMLRTAINQSVRQFSANASSSIKCHRLEGKVAIVTASTDGIGFSIARRLAQEGAKVMISSRREANVKRAVEELKSEGLQVAGTICHVGKAEERKNLLEKTKTDFGGLDILVSNAGINPTVGPVLDSDEEVWDKIFDINVKCTYLLMKESLPLLKCSKSPSIIIISSVAGYQPFNLLGIYSVSKTALLGLIKATTSELADEGIRVNGIAPGVIKTKMSQLLYESEESHELVKMNTSMRRLGTPDEVAGIAAFLASDDASYITGETIIVSGGTNSRL
ncbi:PREDICTED: dehydrogenase/reductase SDR family member 4 [Trachymyrmex cornetzi]|uniref:Dehydrogenase/reductase SDR family member 4 n=1 Tax=Trachymyrmex cornetzi TaxID=471704 RepID=A0A195DF88_9HYME|nr:PREDICTED: dehydrogenase/reductase SDR family member 4 [Trachymyrmex cornetzi]KYN11526.1 Dehydrogenase/reductase SDR family member 4 [Trachymyrmex cornetzi]